MLSSSSNVKTVGHHDKVTAVFNERIVCDGALSAHPLEVKITIKSKTLTMAADGLVAVVHPPSTFQDNVLTISRTDEGTDIDVAAKVYIKNIRGW